MHASDYRCRRNQFVAKTLRPICALCFSFQAQGIGSDERLPVHQNEQEHSHEPVHNTETRQSPGEATQRCCCQKDQDDGTVRAEGSYCSLCGKLIQEQSPADHVESVRPAPLPPEYAHGFPHSLPSELCEDSIDDHNPSTSRRPQRRQDNEDPSPAEGGGKIPVHGMPSL